MRHAQMTHHSLILFKPFAPIHAFYRLLCSSAREPPRSPLPMAAGMRMRTCWLAVGSESYLNLAPLKKQFTTILGLVRAFQSQLSCACLLV